jgi:hypothetical protein
MGTVSRFALPNLFGAIAIWFSGASRLKYRVIRSDGVNGEVSDPRVSGIRQILASGDGGQLWNADGALRFALRVVEIT